MDYIDKILNLKNNIVKTPLYKVDYEYKNIKRSVFVKDESFNLTGSIKIRPAVEIIYDAVVSGKLKENDPIYEASSGNMGIAIAYVGMVINNPVYIFMPKTMSKERIEMIEKYNGHVILTDSFDDAFEKLNEKVNEGFFTSNQFNNPSNTYSHYSSTMKELLESTNENINAFVSGVGTGGTLIGMGKYLKEHNNGKVIALDPMESQILTKGKSLGEHDIQGLSDGIIPGLYDKNIVDDIINVSSIDAIKMAQKINDELKLNVGISSGANLLASVLSNIDNVSTVFPDSSDRYYSTKLFDKSIKSDIVDSIKLIGVKVVQNI